LAGLFHLSVRPPQRLYKELSSDENKTPEYALSHVKARKTLQTFISIYFILYLLSVRKEKGE
jgi:hypothetical protein